MAQDKNYGLPNVRLCLHRDTLTNLYACGACPIAAIWLPRATNFSFVFSLVSPAGFVGSEQD